MCSGTQFIRECTLVNRRQPAAAVERQHDGCVRHGSSAHRAIMPPHPPPDPTGLCSEGGEVIKLHIEGSLTMPMLTIAEALEPDWAVHYDSGYWGVLRLSVATLKP